MHIPSSYMLLHFVGKINYFKIDGEEKIQVYSNQCVCACSVPQLCLTLCDPMDHSLPGSSVHGIFLARILEWVAISFSTN